MPAPSRHSHRRLAAAVALLPLTLPAAAAAAGGGATTAAPAAGAPSAAGTHTAAAPARARTGTSHSTPRAVHARPHAHRAPQPGATAPAGRPVTRQSHTGGQGASVRTLTHARRHHGPRAGGLALTVRHHGRLLAGIAHLAAALGNTIADYSFSPATLTVHVGDTVTWTNTGHQPHTATATNHSFDTGILQHGQSASHTFTAPGTYSYYCVVHPWMKGTIIVLAASTTPTHTTPSTTTPSGTSTTPSSPGASAANSGPSLPMTGIDVSAVLGCGALLTGAGALLRRRVRGEPGARRAGADGAP